MTRTNLCPNPALKYNNKDWFGGGSGAGRVTGQTGFPNRTTAYRDGTTSATILPQGDVVRAKTYTLSAYVKPLSSGRVRAEIHWYKNGSWYQGSSQVTYNVTSGVVTRVRVTGACPNVFGTWTALLHLHDKTCRVVTTQVLYEDGSVLGTYFDGDTVGGAWLGANGNSASTFDSNDTANVFPDSATLGLVAEQPRAERVSDQVVADAAEFGFAAQDAAVKILGEGPPLDLPPAAPEPTWTLFVRNTALVRSAQVDDFTSLDLVSRFNAVGTWELRLDRRAAAAKALTEPGAGIIVYRDDLVVLSGPVKRVERQRDRSKDVLVINGTDDNVWLERRVASPQPGTLKPPYNTSEFDKRNGISSTVVWQYVNVNLGPGALPSRRLPLLTMATDPLVGNAVKGTARWETLLDLISDLAVPGGEVGFKIDWQPGGLVFSVYEPDDKTGSVVFSEELGNLTSFSYSIEAPTLTYVFGGGEGQGKARLIYEDQDAAQTARWGRIEQFVDINTTQEPLPANPTAAQIAARDKELKEDIAQEMAKALAEGGEKLGIEIAPVDTSSLSYGADYVLGDRVSVVIDDVVLSQIVREVHLKLTPRGPQVLVPVLGTPGRKELLRLMGEVRQLKKSTRQLGRR